MKTTLFLLFFLLSASLYCQPQADKKRDYVWVLGYNSLPAPGIEGVYFDFNGDSLSLKYEQKALPIIYTNGSISDENGHLLFYTNGCSIVDSNQMLVPGGEEINAGVKHDQWCGVDGYRVAHSMLILPIANKEEFYFFYLHANEGLPPYNIGIDNFLMTKVKKNNSGAFDVVYSDSLVLHDTLYYGQLNSCRHGNGKGWWLLFSELGTNKKYKFHLTQEGLIEMSAQSIGNQLDSFENSTGGAVFSPDGNKYASYSINADVQIFDFNRCTGELSNPIFVPIQDAADSVYAAGVAFSPNSRYLYATSTNHVYQFDMQAADIAASKIVVAEYSFIDFPPGTGIFNRFWMPQLAPDGKIYVSAPGGKRVLHVIHSPDEPGLACNFEQDAIKLDIWVGGGLPVFPNFRLGPVASIEPSFSFAATGDTVHFANTSTGGTAWFWDFGDGGTDSTASPSHVYAQPGVYQVVLTGSELCASETDTVEVTVLPSGTVERPAPRLCLRPNPSSGKVTLPYAPEGAQVAVYDALGSLVFSETLQVQELDLSALPPGIYLVLLKLDGEAIASEKLVVVK